MQRRNTGKSSTDCLSIAFDKRKIAVPHGRNFGDKILSNMRTNLQKQNKKLQ